MNGRVAHRASLIFLRLVMERWDCRRARVRRERVTLQTQQIHLRAIEQPRIRRAMGRMAAHASFYLYGLVLIHEGSRLVAVALEAAGILCGSGPELPRQESAVRIVTVIALDQPLVDSVTKRTVELLLHFLMTAVTQLRGLLLHQELAFVRVMRRVAVNTTHIVLQVHGPTEIAVFFPIGVAAQTAGTDCLSGRILEREDLGLVSAALDMVFAWSVASLAAMPFRTFLRVQCCYKMRGVFIALIEALGRHVFVAGFADLRSHVLRRIFGRLIRRLLGLLVLISVSVFSGLAASGIAGHHDRDEDKDDWVYRGRG